MEYAKKKRARLIVRNLSFKADEASLKEHFGQCGHVVVSSNARIFLMNKLVWNDRSFASSG